MSFVGREIKQVEGFPMTDHSAGDIYVFHGKQRFSYMKVEIAALQNAGESVKLVEGVCGLGFHSVLIGSILHCYQFVTI